MPAAKRKSRVARRPSGNSKALSSFDGANHSTSRGWIYFPTLDTRREIDTYTHWELVKKARWFYANSGLARRIVNGCGKMVGFLSPKALTKDKEWNELAEANFEKRAGSAQICDLMGKHNFYSIQPKLISNSLKDGDLLLALTKTASGGAAFMPYEAHQIGNSSSTDSTLWENGVRTNLFSRHLGYRIRNGSGHFDISAQDAIYFADFERLNQTRGLTGFAHAINFLHDRTELYRDWKLALKNSAQYGVYKTRTGKGNSPATRMGEGRQKVAPDASNAARKVDLEKVFRGGRVEDLLENEELKTLQDTRPHPNAMTLDDALVRDICGGFDLSPEVAWFIGKVNSVANHFLLADAMKWVELKQQMLVDLFCTRYWVYHNACEIKAGRLRPCQDPDWMMVGWIPQPRLTLNRSKDGKLNIDLHRGAMMTLKRHFAENWAEDWKPNIDDWMDELAYIRDGLKQRGFENLAEVQALLGGHNVSLPGTKSKSAPGAQGTDDEDGDELADAA